MHESHKFEWENVIILDEESHYTKRIRHDKRRKDTKREDKYEIKKRLISEILFIKTQIKCLNLQTDTEGLHKAYFPIIDKLTL